ncbi:MAG: TPM domain-containing protein [Alphaproteobacteria bacterium]|nr:TPM domain-containing protein [Alphaproteobacteria bacterium]
MTDTHLSADDHKRLSAALTGAAKRTKARFELVTVPISDRYALYPIVYGAIVGLTVLGALALFRPELSLRWGFLAAALAFAASSLLFEWLPLRLLLVPKRVKHSHAQAMAHHAFAARVLAQTDLKPGIVFFVSLGERYVQVVADHDVHRHVGQANWDTIIADFTDAARKGRAADGLLGAIEACTKVLETHYPPE